jgi:hypothetical protein
MVAPTVDFVPFATDPAAHVETQADYLANPATALGNGAGIADENFCNKTWRQGAFFSSVIANWIAKVTGADVLDDGSLTGKIAQFVAAFGAIAIIIDQKAINVPGGNSIPGVWTQRDLQTVQNDPAGLVAAGLLTLAANRFTLAPGTWLIEATAPAQASPHRARLYNVTTAAVQVYGTSENSIDSTTIADICQTQSFISTIVTIAVATQYEIDTQVGTNANGTQTLGATTNMGTNEIYTRVKLQKLG